jgi:PhzF family phenazine biosynthesis protein
VDTPSRWTGRPLLNRRDILGPATWACVLAMSRTIKADQMKTESRIDQVEVIRTRVFAAGAKGGNPCPVVLFGDQLYASQMQRLAQKFGLDTVFILKAGDNTADIQLRYFVPDHEMGVSGHATIAAITVALIKKLVRSERVKIRTSSGVFEVAWKREDQSYVITLEQNPPFFGATATAEQAAGALNISVNEIAYESPIQVVSVSRPKLLVPLGDWRILNRLSPDYHALWKLCDALQVSGLYPFTRRTNKEPARAEARQFPLRAGFPEDAATGVAAAALAAYMVLYDLKLKPGHHIFRIAQGYAMGSPSLIDAIADCSNAQVTRTAIRGTAELLQYEMISISS